MEKILRGVSSSQQQGYELCWVACLEMVFSYFDIENKIGQNELIARKYGLAHSKDVVDTQSGKIKPMYDKAVTAEDISTLSFTFGYCIENIVDKNKYWETLKSEINENRPLIANIGFHYVVVVGYSEDAESAYFMYNDPKQAVFRKKRFRNGENINMDDELLTIKKEIPSC